MMFIKDFFRHFTTCLILLSIITFTEQSVFSQSNYNCGLGDYMDGLIQQFPDYENALDEFDANWANYSGGGESLYEIPVVVHIVHDYGPENISDDQVIQTIQRTNERLSGGEGGFDTRIRLRLAGFDPGGKCSNGVVRVQTENPDVEFGTSTDDLSDFDLKSLSRWPTNKFLNIWVVRCILTSSGCFDTGPAGYATLPGTSLPPERDGIVIKYLFMNDESTTLTHEVGHYLSLLHTWGRDFTSNRCFDNCDSYEDDTCLERGDKVCDTDPCYSILFSSSCDPIPSNCVANCPDFPSDQGFLHPKENYMTSAFGSCHNQFTEGQADRMHFALNEYRSELWSLDNKICAGITGFEGEETIIINENTTWSTSNLPNDGKLSIIGNLVIEPGATLRVESGVILRFCENGRVIIKPDARLMLSGTLTSNCDATWKGVEVWGNSDESQLPINGVRAHGWFIGQPGSVINNATIGLQLWGPDYFEDAGGMAGCNGTTFTNNKIAVEFSPYDNFWPYSIPSQWQGQPRNYIGYFQDCNFITDNSYSVADDFQAFLKLVGVQGVRVTRCTLKNVQTSNSFDDIEGYGYGILAIDAGFNVNTSSEFLGLGYGISSLWTAENKPYTVKESLFEDCFIGLYSNSVHSSTVLFNDFRLGQVPDASITSEQVGVMFEGLTPGFTFQENNIEGLTGNASTTIGVICKDLGEFNNEIRRNTYSNLTYGNLAQGDNRGGGLTFGRGLFYFCNENISNQEIDIFVSDLSATGTEIAYNHGLPATDVTGETFYLASGNQFASTSADIVNAEGNLSFHYFYNPSSTGEIPDDVSGISELEAGANPCTEEYCEPPCRTDDELEQEKADYYSSLARTETLEAEIEYAIQIGNFDIVSQKEKELDYYNKDKDQSAFMVVVHLLHDTLTFDPDSLSLWIGNLDVFGIDIQQALVHQANGNLLEAQSLLGQASRKSQTSEQVYSMIDATNFIEALGKKSRFSLPASTVVELEGFTESQSLIANVSKNLLTYYGYHFPPSYKLPEIAGHGVFKESIGNLKDSPIVLSPNPSSGQIDVFWSNPSTSVVQGRLIIRDIQGRIAGTFAIQSNDRKQLDLSSLSPGVYIYQFSAEGITTDQGKLIIH